MGIVLCSGSKELRFSISQHELSSKGSNLLPIPNSDVLHLGLCANSTYVLFNSGCEVAGGEIENVTI